MNLSRATMDDALAVLEWKNDPVSLAASKNPTPVDRGTHLDWFWRSLDNPDRAMLIAHEEGQRLGMVRFDRDSDHWLVSINVAPAERGKGHGTNMLAAAMRAMPPRCRYAAEIRADNAASIALFRRCGFNRTAEFGEFITMERGTRPFDTAEIDGIQ